MKAMNHELFLLRRGSGLFDQCLTSFTPEGHEGHEPEGHEPEGHELVSCGMEKGGCRGKVAKRVIFTRFAPALQLICT
jgi:hypothetical protein